MTLLLRNVQKLVPVNLVRVRADLGLLREAARLSAYHLGLMCVDDGQMREMNRDYRGVDAPTDVLSFPYHQLIPGELPAPVLEEDYNIGDIFLGFPYVAEQARRDEMDLHDMITILLAHGLCHLLGHDHEDHESWQRMINKEMDILGQYNKLTGKSLSPMTVCPEIEEPS